MSALKYLNSTLSHNQIRLLSGRMTATWDVAIGNKSAVCNNGKLCNFLEKFRYFSTTMTNCECPRFLTCSNMNPHVKTMEYAVRGPLVIRATEIEKELEKGKVKPFKTVLKANIGDCHAMGQKPITFIRQVLSLVLNESLFNDPSIPADAKLHAETILKDCKGHSVGSYTDSVGIEVIRKHVTEYISKRDGGIPSNPSDIVLSGGASESIKQFLKLFIHMCDGKKSGVMVPIPQYPLYSATLAEFNLQQVGYYLDESNFWGLSIEELERSISEAKKHCTPRAIVVINPGNPTGQVLTEQNIEDIIKFAYKEGLVILADEVYQHNIYAEGSAFHSFKKVIKRMGSPYADMELASFMSVSKGYMGECGIRGGYMEIINMDPEVKTHLFKCISASLCSSTVGQATVDCVVNPPKKGDPSYALHEKEKNHVLSSLKERAKLVYEAFNSIPGFSCNPVQGAMYAFPRIDFPPKAIEAAKRNNQPVDVFYAFQLLETTGICIVPGSGFGQMPGTYHFRTTILPQTDKLKQMVKDIHDFHMKFLEQYS